MADYGRKNYFEDKVTDSSTTQKNGLGVIRVDGANEYRYVQVVDLPVTLGDALCQAAITEGIVTADRSGGSAVALLCRGVAIGAIASGSYGWIQSKGIGVVQCDGGVAAGDALVPHASEDGHADTVDNASVSVNNDAQVFGFATAADAGSSSGDTATCYLNCP